jgi:predicted phage terminase large subunit-like protein
LEFISDLLVDAEAGRRRRLLISCPPRHGKSTLIAHWFPLWCLAKNPERHVFYVSYAIEFAEEWGLRARNAVRDWGQDVGLQLSDDQTAASRWRLVQGGGMLSSGMYGQIMGRGANIFILDDPIKGEEVHSDHMRDKAWNWFQTNAFSRLEPGGVMIIICTRWHQDDLLGRLERLGDLEGGLPWDVVRLPALAEENDPLGRDVGAPLWPERIPLEELENIKRLESPYNWGSLYQQNPTPEGAGGIKRDWWKFYSVLPEFEVMVQSWDLPLKSEARNDYAVGQVWGRRGAEMFLVHQVRAHMDVVEIMQAMRAMTASYPRAIAKLVEDAALGPAVIRMLHKEVVGIIPWPPKGERNVSKELRVAAIVPLVQAGNVYLPETTEGDKPRWVWDFIEECAAFPNAVNDDQIDATSQALTYLQPQGWAFAAKAARDAMRGPVPENPIELRNAAFSATTRRELRRYEKRVHHGFSGLTRRR